MAKVCSFLNSNENLANKFSVPPAASKWTRVYSCSMKCLCNRPNWRNGGENVWKTTALEGKSHFSTAFCWTSVLVTFSMTMLHFRIRYTCTSSWRIGVWHSLTQSLSAPYGNWHILIQIKTKTLQGADRKEVTKKRNRYTSLPTSNNLCSPAEPF